MTEPGRLEMIRNFIQTQKAPTTKGSSMGVSAYLKDNDRELLKTIVQSHFNKPGYSDKSLMEKINAGDLLKLGGGQISQVHVSKTRKELGFKLAGAGPVTKRSKKFIPGFDDSDRTPPKKVSKEKMSGAGVSLSRLRETIEQALQGVKLASETLDAFEEQQRMLLGD